MQEIRSYVSHNMVALGLLTLRCAGSLAVLQEVDCSRLCIASSARELNPTSGRGNMTTSWKAPCECEERMEKYQR